MGSGQFTRGTGQESRGEGRRGVAMWDGKLFPAVPVPLTQLPDSEFDAIGRCLASCEEW